MKLNIKSVNLFGVLTLAVSGVAFLYSRLSNERLERVCKNLDKSIDELSIDSDSIDISEEIVTEAAKRAADDWSKRALKRISDDIKKDCEKVLTDQIKNDISRIYSDIESDVKREVKEQIGRIDISDAKRQVIADAKERAAEKFQDELDGVLDKFNDNLASVGKIYSSIEKKFS